MTTLDTSCNHHNYVKFYIGQLKCSGPARVQAITSQSPCTYLFLVSPAHTPEQRAGKAVQRKPKASSSQRGHGWLWLSSRWTLTDSLRTSDMGKRHSWNTNSWFVFGKSMIKGKLETIVKINSDSQAFRHVAGCCMTLGSHSGLWPGFN